MATDPARARPSFKARLRRVFFGKPLTHEQMKGMGSADAASRRVDPVALAAQTAHHNTQFHSPGM